MAAAVLGARGFRIFVLWFMVEGLRDRDRVEVGFVYSIVFYGCFGEYVCFLLGILLYGVGFLRVSFKCIRRSFF